MAPSGPAPVTLQISLAPPDLAHAREILPHQLRQVGHQVAEILLAVDTLPPRHGRFAARWEENAAALADFLDTLRRESPLPLRIHRIDYSPPARSQTARAFFDADDIPDKDYRGGPYSCYFHALAAATHDAVLHLDSDILLGGASPTWVAEALALLDSDPRILFTSPLPGPPHPRGLLVRNPPVHEDRAARRHEFDHMSTRLFLCRRSALRDRLGLLTPDPAPWRHRLLGLLETGSGAALPERLLSLRMQERGLRRVDFLGTAPGLWSLHPPYRVPAFYEKLPALIHAVETGGPFPDSQLGFHDISDDLVDWTPARAHARHNRWWRRLPRRWLGR